MRGLGDWVAHPQENRCIHEFSVKLLGELPKRRIVCTQQEAHLRSNGKDR